MQDAIYLQLFFNQQELMFSPSTWFQPKPKTKLDLEKTYLRLQFMIAQEKAKKDVRIKQIQKDYENEDTSIITVIPYKGQFKVSFEHIFNTKTVQGNEEAIKNKIMIKELKCHLEVPKDELLSDFMQSYVKQIKMIILNGHMLENNDVICLYNERDVSVYTPEQIIEVIYEPKGFFERFKNKGKKIIKAIPMTLFGWITKFVGFLLGWFGFGGGVKSFVWKLIPNKMIIQWIVTALAMFFPFLAPLFSIGKMMI